MLPLSKVQDLISKHSRLEKELSSQEIDKKTFAEKSKEYSDLNDIIKEATSYLNFQKNTNFEITNDIKDEHLNKLVSLAQDEPHKYQINSNNKFIYKCDELNSEIRRKKVNTLLDEIF